MLLSRRLQSHHSIAGSQRAVSWIFQNCHARGKDIVLKSFERKFRIQVYGQNKWTKIRDA